MKLAHLPVDFREHVAEQRRAARASVELFIRGCTDGDLALACTGLGRMEVAGATTFGFRRVAELAGLSDDFRREFLTFWIENGDSIRSAVNNDLVLIEALQILLPPYSGPAVTLYRGDSVWNRRRRTYGMSWSNDPEVADAFARTGFWRTCLGGSVVLQATAPPEAILCTVTHFHDDRFGENEYLIDRRRLAKVEAVKRYEQLTGDELRALQAKLLAVTMR